ncbi:MAG TPA: D-aminoacyl-tRNA deacylase, partial [bacterium]|nr:D-aminoacyl-tRNA deacylase [bacterium]
RVLLQRVKRASLRADQTVLGQIGPGMVLLVGIGPQDSQEDIEELAAKILSLRIFSDAEKKMNLSLAQVGGQLMVVSQFTLYGDCTRGCRPDFTRAASGVYARPLYEKFVARLRQEVPDLVAGEFGQELLVEIHNDGPVTFYLQSRRERGSFHQHSP